MKKPTLLALVFMSSVASAQYKTSKWYLMEHDGCIPMETVQKMEPDLSGAKTPQECFKKIRDLPQGHEVFEIDAKKAKHVVLKPLTKVNKFPEVLQKRVTNTNAYVIILGEGDDGQLVFLKGDICNALWALEHEKAGRNESQAGDAPDANTGRR